jgi:hypothetical protein
MTAYLLKRPESSPINMWSCSHGTSFRERQSLYRQRSILGMRRLVPIARQRSILGMRRLVPIARWKQSLAFNFIMSMHSGRCFRWTIIVQIIRYRFHLQFPWSIRLMLSVELTSQKHSTTLHSTGKLSRTSRYKCLYTKILPPTLIPWSRVLHAWSQSPRGIRHEPSSPALILGSWVRIPLYA